MVLGEFCLLLCSDSDVKLVLCVKAAAEVVIGHLYWTSIGSPILKMLDMEQEYLENVEATLEDYSVELTDSKRPFRAQISLDLLPISRTFLPSTVRGTSKADGMLFSNTCMIIRTSELASAQEKLNDLNKRKAEIPLQESMNKTDKKCEALHEQLLGKEIDVAAFVQKHKKLRVVYHKRALTHLAAKTSLGV
ncbi:modifier of rudimentary, Modr [Artemisia annua]|uniref:Modifier of rudimentary, Modr n=1 Tax=Artemisia annua TaxID=35608 RepID=A0A2U1PRG8_ARTAN|nr:modifier of rudimentary, Modr [Artemisia annua]